jgi:hypothetical protein
MVKLQFIYDLRYTIYARWGRRVVNRKSQIANL